MYSEYLGSYIVANQTLVVLVKDQYNKHKHKWDTGTDYP